MPCGRVREKIPWSRFSAQKPQLGNSRIRDCELLYHCYLCTTDVTSGSIACPGWNVGHASDLSFLVSNAIIDQQVVVLEASEWLVLLSKIRERKDRPDAVPGGSCSGTSFLELAMNFLIFSPLCASICTMGRCFPMKAM